MRTLSYILFPFVLAIAWLGWAASGIFWKLYR